MNTDYDCIPLNIIYNQGEWRDLLVSVSVGVILKLNELTLMNKGNFVFEVSPLGLKRKSRIIVKRQIFADTFLQRRNQIWLRTGIVL